MQNLLLGLVVLGAGVLAHVYVQVFIVPSAIKQLGFLVLLAVLRILMGLEGCFHILKWHHRLLELVQSHLTLLVVELIAVQNGLGLIPFPLHEVLQHLLLLAADILD